MTDRYRGSGRRPAVMWTTEEVKRLEGLINEGLSAERIARLLGRTKNSVIGQSHRRKLSWPRTRRIASDRQNPGALLRPPSPEPLDIMSDD